MIKTRGEMMTTVFEKIYVGVKVVGVIGLFIWAILMMCSWVPFAPFAPADIVPHPHPPQPNPNPNPVVSAVNN